MFQLNTLFTTEDLENLYATGSSVAIAKPIVGADPSVVWQLFKPFESNVLEFKEELGLFASNTETVNGAVIDQLTSTGIPAATGKLYTFEDSAVISGPEDGGMAGSYALKNLNPSKPYFTMGLYQDVVVNGQAILGNPISANSVLTNSTITMTSDTTLYIWIESQLKTATLVNNISSPMTKVQFWEGITTVSLQYDAATGTFNQAG